MAEIRQVAPQIVADATQSAGNYPRQRFKQIIYYVYPAKKASADITGLANWF
jgi:hypothetical protein